MGASTVVYLLIAALLPTALYMPIVWLLYRLLIRTVYGPLLEARETAHRDLGNHWLATMTLVSMVQPCRHRGQTLDRVQLQMLGQDRIPLELYQCQHPEHADDPTTTELKCLTCCHYAVGCVSETGNANGYRPAHSGRGSADHATPIGVDLALAGRHMVEHQCGEALDRTARGVYRTGGTEHVATGHNPERDLENPGTTRPGLD